MVMSKPAIIALLIGCSAAAVVTAVVVNKNSQKVQNTTTLESESMDDQGSLYEKQMQEYYEENAVPLEEEEEETVFVNAKSGLLSDADDEDAVAVPIDYIEGPVVGIDETSAKETESSSNRGSSFTSSTTPDLEPTFAEVDNENVLPIDIRESEQESETESQQ